MFWWWFRTIVELLFHNPFPMKTGAHFAVLFSIVFGAVQGADVANPTNQVVELISKLQTTMIMKGEASQEIYNEFAAWCTERAQELGAELKDGRADKKDLESQITAGKATMKSKDVKIDEEAEDVVVSEAEIEKTWSVRKREMRDFKSEEKELISVISMLKRAKTVIEKEMAGGAAMLQLKGVSTFTQALTTMVDASIVTANDAGRLAVFVQTSRAADDDMMLAAPAGATYSSSSGGIVGMLADLLDKAEKELSTIREKEEQAIQNWNLLKASLSDEIRFSIEDKEEAYKQLLAAREEKAIDEGDLGTTIKDVEADVKTLADLRRVCISKVEEFTAMHKSRGEELKALAEAKKVIKETMGGASAKSYGPAASFMQLASTSATHGALAKQALQTVMNLARQDGSTELSQLASKITAAMRAGSLSGEDPFAKVVGMISDMIRQLEQEAKDDANQKEYCDKELSETKQKKADRTTTIEDLTVKIDQMSARSHKLKSQTDKLQKGLAEIAASQSEMDKIRSKEKDEFDDEKKELELGLEGVKKATTTLQSYYGNSDKSHQTRSGTADQIVEMLETIESDFAKSLAELTAGEQAAVTDYETETQDNKVATTAKQTEVEGKTKEFTALDKKIADLKNDREGVQKELDAVTEYLTKLKKECINHMTHFEEMQERRGAEIAGLKEALSILENESAFIQKSSRRALRGRGHQQM